VREARKALFAAEEAYLIATGWVREGKQWVTPNPVYAGRVYEHGHAVNSQKYHEDLAGGSRVVYPPAYMGIKEPLKTHQPLSKAARKALPHPICATMDEYRPFEPPTEPAEKRLAHPGAPRGLHPQALQEPPPALARGRGDSHAPAVDTQGLEAARRPRHASAARFDVLGRARAAGRRFLLTRYYASTT
jgi:hypothetical protein